MWRLLPAIVLSTAAIGCQHFERRFADACFGPETTVEAPATKVEVQTPETIVVKPPTPKVVMEQDESCDSHGCAPRHHKHSCNHPCNPPAYPMQPQAFPQYGAAPGYGAGMIGGEIKDRTALGFMFDTIKIPLPWIRLRAIPQPSEVTFKSQMMPGNYGSPVMMPMAGYGAAPPVAYGAAPPIAYGAPMPPTYGAAPPAYGAPPGGQVIQTGVQTVPVQGYMPVQVPVGPGGAPAYGAPPPSCEAETAADLIKKLEQKKAECDKLDKQIEAFKKSK